MRSSPTTWRPSQTPKGSTVRSCPIFALVSNPILAALFAAFPAVRDRALADPTFLFKLGVEVFGDVGLSVAAEMHSRNDRFDAQEAEGVSSDVVAGSALNAAVLTMLSPTVSFGVSPGGGRALRMLNRVDGRLNDFIRLLFCRALPPAFPASSVRSRDVPALASRRFARAAGRARRGRLRARGVRGTGGRQRRVSPPSEVRARGYSEGYAGSIHPRRRRYRARGGAGARS